MADVECDRHRPDIRRSRRHVEQPPPIPGQSRLPGRQQPGLVQGREADVERRQRERQAQAHGLHLGELVRLNREVAEERPWESVGRGRADDVAGRLADWAGQLLGLARWLEPFLPTTSRRIADAPTAPRIGKCEPPFPRLEG